MPLNYIVRPAIHVIGPSIAYIELTGGYFALVDSEDADRLAQRNWQTSNRSRERIYAMRSGVPMHRIIANPPFYMQVDHRNGQTLHNFKGNLRIATSSQQNQNRRGFKSESGLKGVYRDGSRKKWMVTINFQGRRLHLGRFDTAEDGHAAYCKAAKALHGDFAKLQ